MKKKFAIFAVLFVLLHSGASWANDYTTVYLIRHAEKDLTTERNPTLTSLGENRAVQWSHVFKRVDLDAIYSTDTTRTRDTANPTAAKKNLTVTLYDPAEITKDSILSKHAGKSILIVGHSNTTPTLVNRLIDEDRYKYLDEETDFSSLFLVTLTDKHATAQWLTVPLTQRSSD